MGLQNYPLKHEEGDLCMANFFTVGESKAVSISLYTYLTSQEQRE